LKEIKINWQPNWFTLDLGVCTASAARL